MEQVLEVLYIQILSIYIVNHYPMFPLIRLPVITLLIIQRKFLELLFLVKQNLMMVEKLRSHLVAQQERQIYLQGIGVTPLQMVIGRI